MNRLALPLSARLTALPGIGTQLTEIFCEAGYETLRDLLFAMPYRYVDRGSVKKVRDLDDVFLEGEIVTLLGSIKDIRQSTTAIQRMQLFEALFEDEEGGVLRLVWFNQAYLARVLRKGDRLLVFGSCQKGRHGFEMRSPAFEVLGKGLPGEDPFVKRYLPLYRKQGALTSRLRARTVERALDHLAPIDSMVPPELTRHLPDLRVALKSLHQPPDETDPEALELLETPAHHRLAVEELFAFALGVAVRRSGRFKRRGEIIPTSAELRDRLKAYLPFTLTQAQRRAFKEIVDDLTGGHVMHRMLQGDVGSGKTLVAFLSMAMVAETRGQAALLAPTEVLARQHAKSFEKLLGESKASLQLLLGPMKAKEKREALRRIESGEARYIVGTHALFQESVQFQKLQLIVVDEQHRFGVKQREALKGKGLDPHWLVMSATPIPRSLSLALFGDLDQSILDEKPQGRQPIHSSLIHPDQAEKAWRLLESELEKGHQAYVVSPTIDPSDETKVSLRDIQAMEGLLRQRFPGVELEVVHGRLKADDMALRMGRFVEGASKILLATTVIEVGVDVPNATLMVVDHAERFGLSQLHQLRGRVGRGRAKSHFVMLSAKETERLKVLTHTEDGFKIAAKDLQLRGPGEFFGLRQSGLPQFQVADLMRHQDLLRQCKASAEKVVQAGLNESQMAWLAQESERLKRAEVS